MSKKYVVITSVNSIANDTINFFRDRDWNIIVIGDNKSRNIESNDILTFLSVEDQKKLPFMIIDKLTYNHYSRKNIGYLYAISKGAEIIYDTDDDNFMKESWEFPKFECDQKINSESKIINIFEYFTDEFIWPRGFPISEVRDSKIDGVEMTKSIEIGVWQGLVDNDPDVDSVFRMLFGKSSGDWRNEAPVYIKKGQYTPFNSQNTYWRRDAFAALYLPTRVSFRFCDILRGYAAQKLLWEKDLHVGYCSPNVCQRRNYHNLEEDFNSERETLIGVKKVVEAIDSFKYEGEPRLNIVPIYETLFKAGFVSEAEVESVCLWIEDLERILK